MCYNVMNLQIGNCPPWQFDLGQPPTTYNTQSKYMQLATRLKVQVQLQPSFLFISAFNLGIANGAKVDLKLRLVICRLETIS